MNSKWWKRGAILLLLLFLLFFHLPVIQLQHNQQTYYLSTDTFTLSWIHSVEKEEWSEIYQRQDDSLLLTETRFKTFGAGVPAQGEVIKVEDGFVHMRINREVDALHLNVSENVQTTLKTNETVVPLYELFESNSEVTISSRNVHLWNIFGGRFL